MPPKGTKEGSHHKFFSLRGKKKENRVKKGLSEALGASLGAIGLRPEDEGEPGPDHEHRQPVPVEPASPI
jgi:hypothetical protein